jgi:hypothetical protein
VADRGALVLERLVVVGHPVLRFARIDEGEGERAESELCGQVDRLAVRTGNPHGRVGLLHRLGNDVATGHREVLALVTRVGIHHEHVVGHLLGGLEPHFALLRGVDAESLELRPRRRLARPELHAPARNEVQRRDPLGDLGGMVVARRHQHDPVAEADLLGALRARGQEHLGRGRVRVLLEEVVLHLPGEIDPESIGELDLVERLPIQAQLGPLAPRPRQLVFVEDSELHGGPPVGRRAASGTAPSDSSARFFGQHGCRSSSSGIRSNGSLGAFGAEVAAASPCSKWRNPDHFPTLPAQRATIRLRQRNSCPKRFSTSPRPPARRSRV